MELQGWSSLPKNPRTMEGLGPVCVPVSQACSLSSICCCVSNNAELSGLKQWFCSMGALGGVSCSGSPMLVGRGIIWRLLSHVQWLRLDVLEAGKWSDISVVHVASGAASQLGSLRRGRPLYGGWLRSSHGTGREAEAASPKTKTLKPAQRYFHDWLKQSELRTCRGRRHNP